MARKCFGWSAYELAKNYSSQELADWLQELMNNPENKQNNTTIYIYNKKTKKKMDALSRAITMKIQRARVYEEFYNEHHQ